MSLNHPPTPGVSDNRLGTRSEEDFLSADVPITVLSEDSQPAPAAGSNSPCAVNQLWPESSAIGGGHGGWGAGAGWGRTRTLTGHLRVESLPSWSSAEVQLRLCFRGWTKDGWSKALGKPAAQTLLCPPASLASWKVSWPPLEARVDTLGSSLPGPRESCPQSEGPDGWCPHHPECQEGPSWPFLSSPVGLLGISHFLFLGLCLSREIGIAHLGVKPTDNFQVSKMA